MATIQKGLWLPFKWSVVPIQRGYGNHSKGAVATIQMGLWQQFKGAVALIQGSCGNHSKGLWPHSKAIAQIQRGIQRLYHKFKGAVTTIQKRLWQPFKKTVAPFNGL